MPFGIFIQKHFILSELTLNSTQKRSMLCWAAIQVHYWPMKRTLNNELTIKFKTAKWRKVYLLNVKQLFKKTYIRQKNYFRSLPLNVEKTELFDAFKVEIQVGQLIVSKIQVLKVGQSAKSVVSYWPEIRLKLATFRLA